MKAGIGRDGVHKASSVRSAAFRSSALSLEKAFDRIEIGAVGREVEEHGSDASMAARTARPCGCKVVHDHDVAGAEFGNENLMDIGVESVAVDRPVEEHRRTCR